MTTIEVARWLINKHSINTHDNINKYICLSFSKACILIIIKWSRQVDNSVQTSVKLNGLKRTCYTIHKNYDFPSSNLKADLKVHIYSKINKMYQNKVKIQLKFNFVGRLTVHSRHCDDKSTSHTHNRCCTHNILMSLYIFTMRCVEPSQCW